MASWFGNANNKHFNGATFLQLPVKFVDRAVLSAHWVTYCDIKVHLLQR